MGLPKRVGPCTLQDHAFDLKEDMDGMEADYRERGYRNHLSMASRQESERD
jgi:hypothetical protein